MTTIPHAGDRRQTRHLSPVVDGTVADATADAMKSITELNAMVVQFATTRVPAKPVLRPLVLLDVAQAEQFVDDLYGRIENADDKTLCCLIGESKRHLQKMIDLIRAVTELPR